MISTALLRAVFFIPFTPCPTIRAPQRLAERSCAFATWQLTTKRSASPRRRRVRPAPKNDHASPTLRPQNRD
nr:MAG TPA: hypothetical protein [Caudoviricetes sp.]